MSPASHDLTEEAVMQVSVSCGATARNSAGETLPSCQGSPGMGLGAIAPGWTGRLDLAARDAE